MKRLFPRSLRTSASLFLTGIVATAVMGYFVVVPQSAATFTTFTVNSTLDLPDLNPGDGVCNADVALCTLRAAITESNYSGGANVITVPSGTYALTLGPADDEFNGLGAAMDSGDLDIMDLGAFFGSTLTSVTINGAGAGSTIIDGGGIDRVLDINNFAAGGASVDVTLTGLTIRNGNAPVSSGFNESGGGIQFDGFNNQTFVPGGTLTINNCNITGNTAAGQGGGILAVFGSLNLSGSEASGNTARNAAGGGLSYDGSSFGGLRTLQITNSKISGNHANNGTFGSGGGVFAGGNAAKSIDHTAITNNTAGAQGGGVFNSSGSLTLNFNSIVGNTSAANPASSGLRNNIGPINAANNWWGCNQGPSVSPCDRVSGPTGFDSGPWLVLSHRAIPAATLANTSTVLQADFFTPSSGPPVLPTDLTALDGRAISFSNAVLGTITGADTQISGGKANATFNAGSAGGEGSARATVDHATVTAFITILQAPNGSTDPADQTVCEGDTATFTATSSGFPPPTVQWQMSINGGGSFADIPGATSNVLSFTANASQNGNQYRAVFTNAGGSDTTNAATLTVNTDPVVTTNPSNVAVCEGATASFTAAADGRPTPSVQWQVSTNGGVSYIDISGETNTTLSFTTTAAQNGNRYRAVFTNSCDSDMTTAATLTINPNTSATTPADRTVCQGATATFSTTASGTGPFSYQWKLDGVDITNATNSSVNIDTTSLSAGNHSVAVVVDGACDAVTRTATLTVNTSPTVTLNPQSQTVTNGGDVTFTAAASGEPTPTVQWQVKTNTSNSFSDIPGATSTSYTFTTQPSDNGNQYRAVFTNSCGSATTSAATLTTCTPAAVTGSPASVSDACVGSVVTFSASATGFPTPTVQWQVSTNGGASFSDISGATSTTLNVTASVAVRNNQYRAVFTNSCGTDTTAAATLGVDTVAPVITLNPNSISLWPPNHKYQTINVSSLVTSVTDNCDSNLLSSVVITSVSSDESENGNGDGNTNNDIVIAANCKSVQLRAERQVSGNGRVYRINLKVTDSGGNIQTAMARVYVQNNSVVDDGPANGYTVTSNCP